MSGNSRVTERSAARPLQEGKALRADPTPRMTSVLPPSPSAAKFLGPVWATLALLALGPLPFYRLDPQQQSKQL